MTEPMLEESTLGVRVMPGVDGLLGAASRHEEACLRPGEAMATMQSVIGLIGENSALSGHTTQRKATGGRDEAPVVGGAG